MVNIHPNMEIIDIALYMPAYETIIFSDFHMGYEEALTSRGALIPRFQFKDTMERLSKIFSNIKHKLKNIIINGDLKHEFGTISNQEWRDILKLIDYLSTKAEQIIIVKGNHDVMLDPVTKKRNVKLVKEYRIDKILISHGDTITNNLKKIKTIIIGHDHPALGLKEHSRKENFKCFLKGKWKRKTLIAQPSFNLVVEGTDVLEGKFLSPYLQKSIKNFEVWAVADKPLYFGKIKNLIS
jgi:uncharacterized protein